MSISPKLSMGINLAFVLIGAVAQGVLQIPDFIPAGTTHIVVSTCGFVFAGYGIVNAYLHGYSAPQAGPMVTK